MSLWTSNQVFLNLFSLAPFETFFSLIAPLPPVSGILIPQMYCVSVYVLWLFGRPQTVVISKIFSSPRISFHPFGGDFALIENAWSYPILSH